MALTKLCNLFWILILFTSSLSKEDISRPNFVFILTDDQDLQLGGTIPVMKIRKLIQENGMDFINTFVTTPLCCPSRASILTGRYAHNHQVTNNSVSGNCASAAWQLGPEKETFVTYLKKENYTTYYAGKYLNQYGIKATGGVKYIPKGWDFWLGLVGNSCYYNYTLSVNGKAERHGDNPSTDYLTNVIAKKSLDFLKLYNFSNGPLFMMLAPPSPHKPYSPEPKYKNNFCDRYAPRTINFNIHAGMDKHWLLRQPPNPLPKQIIQYIDEVFRQRWRSLLSVDDMVEKIIHFLEEKNVLHNTYIIFSSDNGFHLGQFCLPEDKRQLYEFDIRVPLFIRGPHIKVKEVIKEPVLNIDLAPTFLELAGIHPPESIDGMSFVPLLHNKSKKWREDFLVEHNGEAKYFIPGCPQYFQAGVNTCEVGCICEDSWNNTYSCLRMFSQHDNSIYCQFNDHEGFVEGYNLTSDPYQMHNIYNFHGRKQQARLKFLKNCRSTHCQK